MVFSLSAGVFKINFFENFIQEYHSNRLDPDLARHFVEPDLGLICFQ